MKDNISTEMYGLIQDFKDGHTDAEQILKLPSDIKTEVILILSRSCSESEHQYRNGMLLKLLPELESIKRETNKK